MASFRRRSDDDHSHAIQRRFIVDESKPAEVAAISIDDLFTAIDQFPADAPYARRGGWVGSTKEQWLGWLAQYDTPGHYDRKGTGYDVKFANNRVQNHQMLLWPLEVAGLDEATLAAARVASEQGKTAGQRAGAVRKHDPRTPRATPSQIDPGVSSLSTASPLTPGDPEQHGMVGT